MLSISDCAISLFDKYLLATMDMTCRNAKKVLHGVMTNQSTASIAHLMNADATAMPHLIFHKIPPITHSIASSGTLAFKKVATTQGYPKYVLDDINGIAAYLSKKAKLVESGIRREAPKDFLHSSDLFKDQPNPLKLY
jgi:hypothetical protein